MPSLSLCSSRDSYVFPDDSHLMTQSKRLTFSDRRTLYIWSGAVVGAMMSKIYDWASWPLSLKPVPLTACDWVDAALAFVLFSFFSL